MSVQFLTDKGFFRLTYKDWSLVQNGVPSPYRSKTYWIVDAQGNKVFRPTKRQRERKLAELQKTEKELEEKSKGGKQYESNEEAREEGRTLVAMLTQIRETPCRYSSRKKDIACARIVIDRLIDWLTLKNKGLTLETIKKHHIETFFKDTHKNLSNNTIHNSLKILKTAVSLIIERRGLNITNPLSVIKFAGIKGLMPKNQINYRELGMFEEAWLHDFWRHVEGLKLSAGEKACIYALMLTGWRVGDCVMLNKSQIDLNHNTIKLLHSKTADSTGALTILYITPHFKKLLTEAIQRADNKGFLWGYIKQETKYRKLDKILKDFIAEREPQDYKEIKIEYGKDGEYRTFRTHTIHSFRRSVITHLKGEGIDSETVRYIVGHSGGNIEEKHYNRFSKKPDALTKAPLLAMEKMILERDEAKEEERLKKLNEVLGSLNVTKGELMYILTKELRKEMLEIDRENAKKLSLATEALKRASLE